MKILGLGLLVLAILGSCLPHKPEAFLRFTRVAEGNISQVARGILDNGAATWFATVEGDASEWGRVRPFHWIFHTVSFVFQMACNGDLFAHDDGYPLSERINGDLVTHALFLLLVFGLAGLCLSWVLWRLAGNWWCALLFVATIPCSLTLNDNLLIYTADSGEIGQLLFLSAYFCAVGPLLMGSALSLRRETASVVFLILSYGMKETSILLLPVVCLILLGQWLLKRHETSLPKAQLLRAAFYNLAAAGSLLLAVYVHKNGAYVSNYRPTIQLSDNLQTSIFALNQGLPIWSALLCLLFLAVLFLATRPDPMRSILREKWPLIAVGLGMCGGFWIINIPWGQPMAKYYLPAYYFGCFALAGLLDLGCAHIKRHGMGWLSWCLFAGVSLHVCREIPAARNSIHKRYDYFYAYRRAIPLVVDDMAQELRSDQPSFCLIAGRNNYQDGALPFLRMANRFHAFNVLRDGKPTHQVSECERNYFRIYPNRPGVLMSVSDNVEGLTHASIVYVYQDQMTAQSAAKLIAMGYARVASMGQGAYAIDKYKTGAPTP